MIKNKMNESDEFRVNGIAIISFPFASLSSSIVINNLAHVLEKITPNTYLISGKVAKITNLPKGLKIRDVGISQHYLRQVNPLIKSAFLWSTKTILIQILISIEIIKLRKNIRTILCMSGCYYQLPIIVAKILQLNVICMSLGIDVASSEVTYSPFITLIIKLLSMIDFTFADSIVVNSLRVSDNPYMARYSSKIVNGALYADRLAIFTNTIPIENRELNIGFVGRLSHEKGILEFLEAIPLVYKLRPDIRFIILGTGQLDEHVQEIVNQDPWLYCVRWIKWVDHDQIPKHLNTLCLVVVPSHIEGIPAVIMEAMCCSTPVLASNVGGIPDLIIDNKTGYILSGTSPNEISRSILRVMASENLKEVTDEANRTIQENYSFEASVKRYQAIFRNLKSS